MLDYIWMKEVNSTTRPTITSIAKEAKVSHSTVSLVLNGRGQELGIKQQTQQRILDVAEKVNYVPNSLARNLRDNKTKTIGVLWGFGRPGAEGMLAAIGNSIWEHGYAAQMVSSLSDPDLIPRALDDMARRCVDGVIFQASRKLLEDPQINRRLDQFSATVAVTDEPLDIPYNQVARDTPAVIEEVVDYLVASGRRRFCFLALSENSNLQKSRPFVERLRYHGLPTENVIIEATKPTGLHYPFNHIDDFQSALARRFPSEFPYDALLGSNDEAAAAALLHMRKLGLRVPKDVALVGFDNVSMNCISDPPLASIGWEHKAAASAIEQLLFAQLSGPRQGPKQIYIPMQFVWRQSAGDFPPKGAAHETSAAQSGGTGVPSVVPAQQEKPVGRISVTHPAIKKMDTLESQRAGTSDTKVDALASSFIHPTNHKPGGGFYRQ